MLSVRNPLLVALLAALVALPVLIFGSAQAAPKYVFKLAHALPEGQTPYHLAAMNFKEKLEKYSNGKASVLIYPGGQLGTDYNVVKKVQAGGVDMEIVAVQLLGGYYPPMDIYSLPFLFPDHASFIRLRKSDFHKELIADMEKKTGLKTMSFIGFSFRHFTNSKRPINSPADMRGLKLRMNQNKVQIASCEALGASAVAMAGAEVFSALQQGVVDGQDSTLNFATANKYFEVQNHIALTYHQLSGSCLIMNARKFNSLPKEIQEAILRAEREMEGDWQAQSIEAEEGAIKIWAEKGCAVTKPGLEPFREAVKPVYEQFADTVGGKNVVERVRKIVGGS